MKTICLPLSLSFLRPYSRKYHQLSYGFLIEITVRPYSNLVALLLFLDIQIFLNHIFENGLLGYFYKGLIISSCTDFYQFHFQSNLISCSGDGTLPLRGLGKGMPCSNQITQVAQQFFLPPSTLSSETKCSDCWISPESFAFVFPEGVVWLTYVSYRKAVCLFLLALFMFWLVLSIQANSYLLVIAIIFKRG